MPATADNRKSLDTVTCCIRAMNGVYRALPSTLGWKVGPRVGLAVCGPLSFLVLLSLSLIVALRVSGAATARRRAGAIADHISKR